MIADPIISLYDTMVYDRKKCRRLSFRGFYYYFLDWLMVKLADIIILDTNENINYFSKNFYADKTKFRRLFIDRKIYCVQKLLIIALDESLLSTSMDILYPLMA